MEPEPILSIRQPWASAIFLAGKDVENRSWLTDYRGRLWIHAATRRDRRLVADPRLAFLLDALPSGVLGSVELVDVVRRSSSRWAEAAADYYWILANPRPLARPVARRGYPGLTWFDPSNLE